MRLDYDVVIIGGGINGCGCAADAALRGLSVLLCEKDDLASKTSSSSSKLIHGGLRYLEHYDFALVKKALDERDMLLHVAPHLVHPLPFVLPHKRGMRPAWFLRMGLFLYDHLSRNNQLPSSQPITREQQPSYFTPLKPNFTRGFYFFDCATDDARLTLANALQARNHGAAIHTQTECIQAEVVNKQWRVTLKPKGEEPRQIRAKVLINATGPWVEPINTLLQMPVEHPLTLVKGSHVVVPKLYEGQQAYFLQHLDKRIVFAIPYHGATMVGTTEVPFNGSCDSVHIDAEEIDYLLEVVQTYFAQSLGKEDIITSWSGVRPLLQHPGKKMTKLSRDYAFELYHNPAPAVTIYGGKITTYRQLALQVVDALRAVFPELGPSRTHVTRLPGANWNAMLWVDYQNYAEEKYHWLDKATRERYLATYGTLTEKILSGCESMRDLGLRLGDTLYEVEVDYLIREEWATSCEDILWRRTKLGLQHDMASQQALAVYLQQKIPPESRMRAC